MKLIICIWLSGWKWKMKAASREKPASARAARRKEADCPSRSGRGVI